MSVINYYIFIRHLTKVPLYVASLPTQSLIFVDPNKETEQQKPLPSILSSSSNDFDLVFVFSHLTFSSSFHNNTVATWMEMFFLRWCFCSKNCYHYADKPFFSEWSLEESVLRLTKMNTFSE
jgi:hypothetical protein